MARQEIILGVAPTGLGGDPPRTASTKINAMTAELYGIAPLARGGTGSDTAAGARTNLGLGTAAVANLTTSVADATAGRVLKNADWGIGSNTVPIAPTVNLTQSGFWRWDTSTAFYANYGALNGSIISCGFDGESVAQVFIGRITTNLIGFRSGGGSFNIIYHTGNTTKAADGTLKAI